jgi:high-affinity nickel-transport protein
LGHSTIVFLLAAGLALATQAVKSSLPHLEAVGGVLGTIISAAFLYLIAFLNLVILRDIYLAFREVRQVRLTRERVLQLEEALLRRGLMNRVLGRAYRAIRSSWKMYPVGILFGLGFDTASEVALLGLSALAAGKNLPLAAVLVLPLMFAAGMSLVDTLDGVIMQYAYGWAFLNPIRKVYYNLSITAVSVLVALGVGSIEWLQVIGNELAFKGAFWNFLQALNFSTLGYLIIAVLLLSWGVSIAIYRIKGYDKAVAGEEIG